MKLKVCVICEANFDLSSSEKKRAGGKSTHCPDCSEETAVKHLGVGDGCGKQTAVQVLSFQSEKDKQEFNSYWRAATGMYNGKACHFAYLPKPITMKFKKVTEHGGNVNHKGKS